MKKIAVKVSSKREFEAVLDKIHRKDWRKFIGGYSESVLITYSIIGSEFTLIDFDTFATLLNIELPKEDVIVKLATNEECKVNKHGVDFDEPLQSL
jgi:glutamate formiminotransferase